MKATMRDLVGHRIIDVGKRFWTAWGLDRAKLIEQYNSKYEQEKAA